MDVYVLKTVFTMTLLLLMVFAGTADCSDVTDKVVSSPNGVCTEGYFQCENGTLCIPQNSNCDGIVDCPSGSDEINCDDIHADNYWDHLYRKRPLAEHDDLDPSCQLPYKGSCICRSKDLICHYKNYTETPKDLPQVPIDLLDFMGNNFGIVSSETLRTVPSMISKLSLTHCNIQDIRRGAFYNLSDIEELRLDNNDLKTFPPDVFMEGNKLKALLIMYNHISKIHPDGFRELRELEELDLRGNELTDIRREFLEPLESLKKLHLPMNQIVSVDVRCFPSIPITELSLAENKIMSIGPAAFSNIPTLEALYLSDNKLTQLKNKSFYNLTRLTSLTLNDNFIRTIESGVFEDVPNLNSLKLEKNQFRTLDKKVLLPLQKLPNIYFDRFELCAVATHIRVCHPKGDGISSQEHLLHNPLLRASVWIMAVVGCTGNIIVLLGRRFAPTNNVVHSLYLRNLALSDLLMGVYLFIIATADEHYRGVYLMHQYIWRHSYICSMCGFLSTLSCESSVLILTLVTWDRFISITQPLARKQPSPRTAALTLLILWLIATTVALAPLTSFTRNYFGDEFYGSNGVCLALHIHDPYTKGWEYSAAMFVVVNAAALAFICYAYMRMINEIRASGVACRSTRQSQDRDKVAQRFTIIVSTDCMNWVPVIIVKIIALAGIPISQSIYAWLAIYVLPINSALNPVLYTLTTTVFKKQVRKLLNSLLYKRRRVDQQHSAASESGFSLSFGVFPIGGSSRRIRRGTQSSVTTSKNSCNRLPTAV